MAHETRYLTTRQVADLFGVHVSTISRRTAAGELVASPFGSGPRAPLMFSTDDNPTIAAALTEQEAAA